MLWLLGPAALAATPNPDRPSVSRSGWLVAPDTLEMELGAQWAGTRTVPATLKYAWGRVLETRVSSNLAGVEAGTPGLEGGLKIRLLDQKDYGLALWAASAIPVTRDEGWYGQLHGLFTVSLDHGIGLQLNGGLDVAGEFEFAGVPLVGLVSVAPTRKFSLFAELAGRAGMPGCDGAQCAYGNIVIDGGAGFLLTEILIVDGGVGWDLLNDQPYATVGITANFGSVK